MDTFEKSNLRYDYTWSQYDAEDPRVFGPLDNTTFNRQEGEEVYYLIKTLTEHVAWDVGSFGHKIEALIRHHLPGEITTQKEVMAWIRRHWAESAAEAA